MRNAILIGILFAAVGVAYVFIAHNVDDQVSDPVAYGPILLGPDENFLKEHPAPEGYDNIVVCGGRH